MLLGVANVQAQRGAYTQSRNLAELVTQSATIVRGYVVSAKVEPHPELHNLSTVVVTLRVAETLKGEAGETLTFRQFIWDLRDRSDAAGYRKGQHLLLLMNPTTPYGLTSPAGLGQGRFQIARDAAGRETATNGHGNAGLFRGLEAQLKAKRVELAPRFSTLVRDHRSGAVALNDLKQLVQQLDALHLR
jgi:hypothetical protein